jgi:two-component system CheB/CheR fusion protein
LKKRKKPSKSNVRKAPISEPGGESNARRVASAQRLKTPSRQLPTKPRPANADSFCIVGVGASAGGLEAFSELLKHLPPDTGMAFVLVQHLDPKHESALTQLLTRVTRIPVREVTNNLQVEANHIYVIPPNANLMIERRVLKLQSRAGLAGPSRSIDSFFESLAQDQRGRAIGVILSGTATDGTLGLEAIKAEGGITFAQDDSAKYNSMPNSAVAAGCVDFVLNPRDIAKELDRIAKHPCVAGLPLGPVTSEEPPAPPTARQELRQKRAAQTRVDTETPRGAAGNGYKKVLLLLRNHSGVDFSLYKPSTIQRRIARRMVLSKKNTLEEYADFLRGNTAELDYLYSDALISVTSFFRNPEAFVVLQRKIFPKLLGQRGDEPIRVWILGCSTGQEAYSIAMAFVECAEKASRMRKLQVFATDLNETLLGKARHGFYAKSLVQDVSPERLRKFFVEEDGSYRVSKALREMVVFARQNLITDPPFSRMDLICCRNLLIYLEPSVQKKVLPSFHYALKPHGFLLLGSSESIGEFTDLFEPVEKKHKIFSKKAAPAPMPHLPAKIHPSEAPSTGVRPAHTHLIGTGRTEPKAEGCQMELNAQREADRVAVNQFAPAGVLINADLQVLQFRGPTGAYLEPPPGKASFDLLKMAREGLMLPLRSAINKAKRENKTVRKENVSVRHDGGQRTVNVHVIPLKNLRERCFLVLFEEQKEISQKQTKETKKGRKETSASLSSLASVKSSRRIADLEHELYETRDFVQSIQEQYEAANEELQASNEEVTSANEELQSVNEELETSKEELESANEELTTVNEEMANRNAELSRLNADLNNLQNSTKLPIVLIGRDLTVRRFNADGQKKFNLMASDIGRPLNSIRHNLLAAPSATTRTSGASRTSKSDARRKPSRPPAPSRFEAGPSTGALPTMAPPQPLKLEVLTREVIDTQREQEHDVRDEHGRWFSLRLRPYMNLDNKVDGAVLVLLDIDAIKQTERVQAALAFAQSTVDTVREPLLVLDGNLRVRSAGRAFYKTFQVSAEETIGHFIYELGNQQWNIPRLRTLLEEILPQRTTLENFEVDLNFEQVGHRTMLLNARRLEDEASNSQWILLAIEDVTERKHHEEEFQAARIAAAVVRTAPDPVLILNADLRVHAANEAFYKTFKVSASESEGRSLFELGNGQWKVSRLRELLEGILPRNSFFDNFAVTHDFERIGSRTMLLYGRRLDESADSVPRILLGIKDITESLHFQAELRRAELRYRRLFEAAKDGVLIVDPVDRKIIDANPYLIELLGYAREELLGQELWQIGLLKDELASHSAFREIQERGVIRFDDLPVQTKSGEQREIEVVANRYAEDAKEVIQWNIRDITQRKQAEHVRARLAAIVDWSDDAIISKDLEGRITSWNRGAERLFGYEAAEAIGQSVTLLIPPDRTDEEAGILERIRRGEPIDHYETIRCRKDGTLLNVSLTVSPIRDARGRIAGASKIARDITEQKRAEEALREAKDRLADQAGELERLVKKRTAELSATNEQLEAFVYSIAHDLRAPLRAMQGFSAALLEETGAGLGEAGQDFAQRINRSAQFMDALLIDLLNFSRVSQQRLELTSLELETVVGSVLDRLAEEIQKKKAEVRSQGPWPAVRAHEATLAQALFNLASNALKFAAPDKTPVVRLRAEERGTLARIWVEDNGIGIAPDHQQQIFRLFTRLHGEKYPGTGIGLAIVQKGIERMDGRVGVESTVGKGSRFWIDLQKG